jgi:hypothetical protein
VWRAVYEVCDNDNPGTRAGLYRELLNGVFVVPKVDHLKLEQINPAPNKKPTFPLVEVGPGMKGLVIFTSTGALRAWLPSGCGYVLMQGQNMFLMAADLKAKAVAVNPGSSPSGLLLDWEVQRLAEGAIPLPANDSTLLGGIEGQVAWGPLEEALPSRFVEETKVFLASQPEVKTAYALQASFNHAPRRLVVAVSCPVVPNDSRLSEFMPVLVKIAESHRLDAYCVIAEQHAWLADIQGKIAPFFARTA